MFWVRAARLPQRGLPPCGGSGLKYIFHAGKYVALESPSMRREWIEIFIVGIGNRLSIRLPPCGGSGLKYRKCRIYDTADTSPSMRREWIEIAAASQVWNSSRGLPPCGGSGLKYLLRLRHTEPDQWSPSMRREWIEMYRRRCCQSCFCVSLHAEGVD